MKGKVKVKFVWVGWESFVQAEVEWVFCTGLGGSKRRLILLGVGWRGIWQVGVL